MGGGVFTREERAVVLFLVLSLSVGCAILGAGRVLPSDLPGFGVREPPEEGDAVSAEPSWPVDINTAGIEDLVRLPGIGPAKAAAIVRLRSDRGPYGSVEELLDVRGIGRVTLEGILPLATVGAVSADDPGDLEAACADSTIGAGGRELRR
jgi:competence protein ComEA